MTTRSKAPASTPDERDPLDASRRAELRHLLESHRDELRRQISVLIDETGQVDSTSATRGQGETEHTAVDIERRVGDMLATRAEDALSEIAAALQRMDDDTYGRCERCEAPIPFDRLVAIPATRYCIGCQQRIDARR